MREFEWIEWLSSRTAGLDGVSLGIGDDAAVLDQGRFDLVALDTMVQGVHFRRDFSSPFDGGWKLLASNLSDIAAMGGRCGPYLLGMSLGKDADEAFIQGFVQGLEAAAKALVPGNLSVGPIGGDTTRSPGPTILSLTLLGQSPSKTSAPDSVSRASSGAVLRSGAKPGHKVGVIGHLGGAAAGLEVLLRDAPGQDGPWANLVKAHRRPHPWCEMGELLGELGLASAMLDVSDGLAQDLGHILKASAVGARLELGAVPLMPGVKECAEALGGDALAWACGGGDDYALALTAPPEAVAQIEALAAQKGAPVAWIGVCWEPSKGMVWINKAGQRVQPGAQGYEHTFGDKST